MKLDVEFEESNQLIEMAFEEVQEVQGVQQINLADYVKKTDCATNEHIDDRASEHPIAPDTIDYAVMSALTDSRLEWTDEQKQQARETLGVQEASGTGGTSGTGGSEYPKKVFEYEWKDNYDKIDVTSIDYETGILTVSSMPTQITDDVSTTVRVFPSLKIEGIAEQFKYGMMPKEIMETHCFYYAKKVGDNHVILCNPINSNELTSITNSDVVDLTRWNLFVEKKRNSAIPNVDVKNLDKTHRYKLRYYIPHAIHHTGGITVFTKNNSIANNDKYGSGYGFGYASKTIILKDIDENPFVFITNTYETVSLRGKHYAYSENVLVKYPKFYEVDICKLSDESYKADVNIGYFAPFTSPKDNTVFCMSTVKQNIFLQRPYKCISFFAGNGHYILDGARCEVWDYGEVL